MGNWAVQCNSVTNHMSIHFALSCLDEEILF